MQRQVRLNRVPEKVPQKVWEALEQAEVFPALGFAARFRNMCRNTMFAAVGDTTEAYWFFQCYVFVVHAVFCKDHNMCSRNPLVTLCASDRSRCGALLTWLAACSSLWACQMDLLVSRCSF